MTTFHDYTAAKSARDAWVAISQHLLVRLLRPHLTEDDLARASQQIEEAVSGIDDTLAEMQREITDRRKVYAIPEPGQAYCIADLPGEDEDPSRRDFDLEPIT